jgi:hypothetical protein
MVKIPLRCKGTKKNAHTQVKRAIFVKRIDYLSHTMFSTHSSLLESEVLNVGYKVKPDFCKYCEQTEVWAAFCHIASRWANEFTNEVGVLEVQINTHTQEKLVFVAIGYMFSLYFDLFS